MITIRIWRGRLRIVLIALLLLPGSLFAKNQSDVFSEAKEYYQKGNKHRALFELIDIKDSEKIPTTDQALKYFAMGVWAQDLQRWDEAEAHLKKSMELDSQLLPYVHYQLGHLFNKKAELHKAASEFNRTIELKPPRNIILSTKFQLSEIYIAQKKWKEAHKHLYYLQRKWRGAKNYPEVLWRLIKVDRERNRKSKSCNWARKLYADYPSHPLVYDWGISLEDASFEGKKLDCLARQRDIAKRIRRLQWGGEADRARAELENLRKVYKGNDTFVVDSMLANFLVNQGYVEEALKILLGYYDSQKRDFDYLMDLAKAASRAGEFQTAVGAYYKAYRMRPLRKDGRRALFRAAFLSYQFQDYDGAGRKFEEFTRKYKRSGLSRDAKWHLAWIKYLKGDYTGASQGFQKLLVLKKKHKRKWRKFSEEKISYWLGMSYMRAGQFAQAKAMFNDLVNIGLYSFYSQAAETRLKAMPKEVKSQSLMQAKRDVSSLDNEEVENAAEDSLDEETEDEMDNEEEVEVAEEDEVVKPIAFKDPKLKQYFLRAQNFMRLGFYDLAKWELYEIERRTTNRDYLKLLMSAYESIGSYHRSAYIGEIFFFTPRKRQGFDKAKDLWQFTYPQAYSEHVERYSGRFDVSQDFIWGIMRAESRYRHDVVSPVGAKGLMQIMPFTGKQVSKLIGEKSFNKAQLGDPKTNVKLGSRYLKRLLKKFDGTMPLAAAGYNAGPHRVENWLATFGNLDMDEFIEHIPFVETRNYVKKVIHFSRVYNRLYSDKKTTDVAWLGKPVPVKLEKRPASRENWDIIQ